MLVERDHDFVQVWGFVLKSPREQNKMIKFKCLEWTSLPASSCLEQPMTEKEGFLKFRTEVLTFDMEQI